MQLSLGLGIGALSVLAAPSGSDLSPSPTAQFRAAFSIGNDADVVVEEDALAWYGTAWVDFLGTQGEWHEEQIDAETLVLTPIGEDCSFGLRQVWNDRVVYFPMARGAELAFDRHWILVNQRGSLHLRERREAAPGAATAPLACDQEWPSSMVGMINYDGECWAEMEAPETCDLAIECGVPGGVTEGCDLRVTLMHSGKAVHVYFASGCESSLSVTECTNEPNRSTVCVTE